jgi:hypothetical protein
MRQMRMPIATLLTLLILLAVPASVSAGADNSVMQAQDTQQPSAENNTFYVWGRDSGTPCWGHFNNTDSGTDPDGYAEKVQANGKMEIEWTCRMDPALSEDFALEDGADISIHLMIDVAGQWDNANGCNNDCEDLNVSLMKGGLEVARYHYTTLTTGENEVILTFPVNETLQVWDYNTDNPAIRVRMVLYPTQGFGCGWLFDCDAKFRMYYSGQDEAQYNATVTFPILNATAAEDILGNDDPNASEDEKTPGFGIFAAAAAISVAALARRKKQ